jgi:predicted nucleic acid-binding Zn ribbon protein
VSADPPPPTGSTNPTGAPAAPGSPDPSDPPAGDDTGPDAVRSALNRARASAASRGLRPGAAPAPRRRRRPGEAPRSGSGADARDPQLVSRALDRLVTERGWEAPVAVGGVIGRWEVVVGAEIAAHCRPEHFEDGVLTVRADSTAWATQVRLLAPSLLRKLDEEVGEGTVVKVVVQGPTAPSWRKGVRVAPGGQGPRDTYG